MANNVKILLVEDDLITRKSIRQNLKSLGYSSVFQAQNSDKALKIIKENPVDIALLNTGLNGSKLDGIELAAEINRISNTKIIFITSNTDKITLERTDSVYHHNYLVKPVEEKQLYVSILKAISHQIPGISNNGSTCALAPYQLESIYIKGKDRFYNRIDIKDILYFKTELGGTSIYTLKTKLFSYTSLKSLLDIIRNKNIIRIHKSIAINTAHVTAKSENEIKLVNGAVHPIGKSFGCDLGKYFEVVRPRG